MKKGLLAALALMLFTVADLQAQKPVSIEAGLFGQYTKIDRELQMDDVFTIGGRLGFFVIWPDFSVEFDGQYGKTDWDSPNGVKSIDFMPWAVRGVYALPLGERLRIMVGLGYQQNIYKGRVQHFASGAVAGNEFENAISPLLGVKYCLGEKWSLRADGVLDHNSSPNFNGSTIFLDGKSTSYGFRVGMSRMLKGYCYERPVVAPPPPPIVAAPAPPTPAPVQEPPPNAPPRASITSPTSGASVTGPVNFAGTCTDPEQGNIASSARWSSSRDGDIGTGASFTRSLTPGSHTITLTCTDGAGLTNTATVSLVSQELLVRLNWVHFDFNRAVLTKAGRDTLDRVIGTLQQRGDARVAIEGHTDPYGAEDYNQRLSERRAQAVVDYLVKGGVAASRIVQKGFGEQCLMVDDDHERPKLTKAQHRENRRVEVWSVGDTGAAASCRPRQ